MQVQVEERQLMTTKPAKVGAQRSVRTNRAEAGSSVALVSAAGRVRAVRRGLTLAAVGWVLVGCGDDPARPDPEPAAELEMEAKVMDDAGVRHTEVAEWSASGAAFTP